MPDLRRELSLFDATTINVGTMIASAIFIVPSTVALQLRMPALAILVWVVGGLVSLLGALCMAELGAAFPQAGGLFVYLREGFGPVWGFLYGWAVAALVNPASIAAIAAAFATYLGFFVPPSLG
jgi:amino acid transporter